MTNISSDRVHSFNERTLAMDEELRAGFEIDLLIMPEELRKNSIVAAQWHTAGDKQVCPLCASLDGNIIPVDSPEWGRISPPSHQLCRCVLSYITAQERGVQARIEKYEPVDPDLLKRWSSKIYTDVEIKAMVKHQAESKLPFHENLTQVEKDALDRYSGTAYKDMRRYMKGGAPERTALRKEWGSEWYDKIKEDSETILKLFRKYHDGQAKLAIHRSLGDLDETFYSRMKAYKSGDAISIDKSMTSWTTDSKITDDFVGGTHRVKFSLRKGRKTTKELDVWKYSSQPQEKEVLVSTTDFKVIEVKEVIDKEAGTNTLNIILGEV